MEKNRAGNPIDQPIAHKESVQILLGCFSLITSSGKYFISDKFLLISIVIDYSNGHESISLHLFVDPFPQRADHFIISVLDLQLSFAREKGGNLGPFVAPVADLIPQLQVLLNTPIIIIRVDLQIIFISLSYLFGVVLGHGGAVFLQQFLNLGPGKSFHLSIIFYFFLFLSRPVLFFLAQPLESPQTHFAVLSHKVL